MNTLVGIDVHVKFCNRSCDDVGPLGCIRRNAAHEGIKASLLFVSNVAADPRYVA